jgi:hypothetical protein
MDTMHSHILSSKFPSLTLQREATRARIAAVEGLRHDSHMHADIQKAGRFRLGMLLSKLSTGNSKLAVYKPGCGYGVMQGGVGVLQCGVEVQYGGVRVLQGQAYNFFERRRF